MIKLDRDDFGVYAITLVPNQIEEIEFMNRPLAIEIDSDGNGRIYSTINGEDPVVGSSKTREIPDYPAVRVINIPPSAIDEPLIVKLISAGAPTISMAKFQGKS